MTQLSLSNTLLSSTYSSCCSDLSTQAYYCALRGLLHCFSFLGIPGVRIRFENCKTDHTETPLTQSHRPPSKWTELFLKQELNTLILFSTFFSPTVEKGQCQHKEGIRGTTPSSRNIHKQPLEKLSHNQLCMTVFLDSIHSPIACSLPLFVCKKQLTRINYY